MYLSSHEAPLDGSASPLNQFQSLLIPQIEPTVIPPHFRAFQNQLFQNQPFFSFFDFDSSLLFSSFSSSSSLPKSHLTPLYTSATAPTPVATKPAVRRIFFPGSLLQVSLLRTASRCSPVKCLRDAQVHSSFFWDDVLSFPLSGFIILESWSAWSFPWETTSSNFQSSFEKSETLDCTSAIFSFTFWSFSLSNWTFASSWTTWIDW